MAARDAALVQMKTDARNATAQRQAEINAAKAEALAKKSDIGSTFDYDKMMTNLDDINGNTASMAKSMDISSEELKYLRDAAEQQVINRFTTAEFKIEMNNENHISSEMDIDGVINKLEEKLYETYLVSGEGVHL